MLHTGLSSGASSSSDRFADSMRAAGLTVVGSVGFTSGADSPASIANQIAATGADPIMSITLAP